MPRRPGCLDPRRTSSRALDGELGERFLQVEEANALLFTENESNTERLVRRPNRTPYVKDGIQRYVFHGNRPR